LAELEAEYVRETLAATKGNKSKAATILGISRKNLYERLARDGEEVRDQKSEVREKRSERASEIESHSDRDDSHG
jgi:transcriptional regulator of acetoin/glycerol metabolism